MVEVPELSTGRAQLSLTVLECARNPTRALHLARFFGARDRGLQTFAQKGFTPVEGDVWADSPEITFYCGAVNRRAIEPVLNEFREREGVQINTVFNGCGILTGQMKSILADGDMPGFPDTYMACDVHYLNVVRELFQDDVNVSDTRLVICVPRGNPKQIKSLDDLAQPGISLALGQPDQCTIGVLTKNVLQQAGLYDKVLANHPAEKPTSAMLVPAVTTGAVDATLAYATDAKSSAGKLDIIPIELDTARAIQPFSIARSSQHINLSRRLFEHLARSRHHFEAAGFHWRLDDDAAAPRDAE